MVPAAASAATAERERPAGAEQRLRHDAGNRVHVERRPGSGLARLIGVVDRRNPVPAAAAGGGATAADTASAAARFTHRYAEMFGVDDARQLRSTGRGRHAGLVSERFQQHVDGVPVLGGELVTVVDEGGNLLSIAGEATTRAPATDPSVAPTAAAETARRHAAEAHGAPAAALDASDPILEVFDPTIVGDPEGPAVLVWDVAVSGEGAAGPVGERVLVAATGDGRVVRSWSDVHTAKTRYVCDNADTAGADLTCDGPYARTEGGSVSGVTDVNSAYDLTGLTYDYFFESFERDSVDDAGLPLRSTVRFCFSSSDCPYANAFWYQNQMTFGAGYAGADDVIAHELAHGVTDTESDLLYMNESGAINESLSDVFGELFDLWRVDGNDTAANRWRLGEDIPGGAIRDMENPPLYGDPDRMTSSLYHRESTDSGGVHINSGVGNKAAFLLTDGGTFNGATVTGLGTTKVGRIYYTINTALLTGASDYLDLAAALPQACTNLVGTAGITSDDCTEVADAVDAVDMDHDETQLDAACAPGLSEVDLFSDAIEVGSTGVWTTASPIGSYDWGYATASPSSGTRSLYGPDPGTTADLSIVMPTAVSIPSDATFAEFDHRFAFDTFGGGYYDGGVVEASVNGGTYGNLGSRFTENGYTGTISSAYDNPLKGKAAFVGASGLYRRSRIDLSAYAGSNVRLRFRIGADSVVDDQGWFVDDVRIYKCVNTTPAPVVTSVSPDDGPTGGGTSVTITGTGFTDATVVRFGSTAATSFTIHDDTSITAVSPARSAGPVNVKVESAGGTSTSSPSSVFTYVATPVITSLSPTTGAPEGGTSVTITGTGFTGATSVSFGAVPAASFTVNSGTSITAVSPEHELGAVDVEVTTPGGTSVASSATTFTFASFVPLPVISSLSPKKGPTAGRTSVTITGTDLTDATAVRFGTTDASSFTVNGDTSITAESPALTAGAVHVRVETAGGTSATSTATKFTYLAPPVVASLSPTSGPTAGGTSVTITGSALKGASSVRFGEVAAASFTVNNGTSITAVSPAHAGGAVDVTVVTAGGTSGTSSSTDFTYVVPAPVVSSLAPTSGPTSGGTSVTITGTGFTDASVVRFGSTPAASFTVSSPTSITAVSPARSAGSVNVRVETAGGTSASSSASTFTFVSSDPLPVVTSLTPTSGPTGGGTSVTITGSGFTSVSAVRFAKTSTTGFVVNSSTSITVVTPPGLAGTVAVRVVTSAGTSATSSATKFTYL